MKGHLAHGGTDDSCFLEVWCHDVDGAFLHRPPLPDYWDYSVFADTPMALARARGVARDADALGGLDAAGEAFDRRYHAACRIHLAEVDPRSQATVVLPGIDRMLSKGHD